MQSLRCSPAIWAAIPHGRDRPSASRFVAMSIFLLLSKTHTLMPQKLIWATQVAGFRRSLLHHTGCSFWQRRQTENLALPVQRSHWGICGAVPAQTQTMLHSPFGAAYILLVPHPWLWHTPLPWHSRRSEHLRTCGTSVTQLPYIPAHHCSPTSTLPALAQAGRGRHECTCRGVAEPETVISRLWLTDTFPFGHSSFPFRFPLWKDP